MWQNLRLYFSHRPTASVGIAFIMMSLGFGTWITRIPDIKSHTGLSEGELGIALLGMPIGAILIMGFMGPLIHRFGVGGVTWASSSVYALALILPALATGLASLTVSLVLVGISAGAMDVAMNAAAAAMERQRKRLVMSTSHALFSFGGMIGAGTGSVVAGLGISTLIHFLGISVILLGLTLIVKGTWLAIEDNKEGSHRWSWPGRSLLLLAFAGLCVLLSEGAIADWSAIYIRETLGGSTFLGGLGFAGFSLTMAVGRFYGDLLIPKIGAASMVRWGGLLASFSLGTALLVAMPGMAIFGFTLAGLGLSCIVPIVFSAAASIPGVSPGTGIASVSSVGYLGFMAGPPAIGFVAEEFGLSYGLSLVVVICLLIAVIPKGTFGSTRG
jgi:MFS family permease